MLHTFIDDNHSKIFISEENKSCVRGDNKSIHIKILNEFKDIRKSYGINVINTLIIITKLMSLVL